MRDKADIAPGPATAWPGTGGPAIERRRFKVPDTLHARGQDKHPQTACPRGGHAVARRPAALFRAGVLRNQRPRCARRPQGNQTPLRRDAALSPINRVPQGMRDNSSPPPSEITTRSPGLIAGTASGLLRIDASKSQATFLVAVLHATCDTAVSTAIIAGAFQMTSAARNLSTPRFCLKGRHKEDGDRRSQDFFITSVLPVRTTNSRPNA